MSDNTYYVNFRQIIGLLIVDKNIALKECQQEFFA